MYFLTYDMNSRIRLDQFCQSLLFSSFIDFLIHPHLCIDCVVCSHKPSPHLSKRIISPHPTIGSISTRHQSRLHLSPSSHTVIHIVTDIIPTHEQHSYFWLASHLDISAPSSSRPTHHHHSSNASLHHLPSSEIFNISHRLSRLCNSVSFRTSIYTCNSITPTSFSTASHTASQLSFLHYSHSLSIISHSVILVTNYPVSAHTFKTHRTSCMTV